MAVYVDSAFIPYGRMKMSHMVADTTDELLRMADAIGIDRKWIQYKGHYREHFDISMSKRDLAIFNGAEIITRSELGNFVRKKKELFEMNKRGDVLDDF